MLRTDGRIGLLATLGQQGLTLVLGIPSAIVLARGLGPAARGDLAALQSLVSIAALIFGMGLPKAAVQLIGVGGLSRRSLISRRVARIALMQGLVAATIVPAILYYAVPSVSKGVLAISTVYLLGKLISAYQETLARIRQINVVLALAGIVAVAVPLVLYVAFGLLADLSVGSVLGIRASAVALAIGVVWYAFRSVSRLPVALHVDVGALADDSGGADPGYSSIIGSALAHFVVSLVIMATLDIDVYLIRALKSSESAGTYAVAVAIAEIGLAVPSAIGFILYPKIANRAVNVGDLAGRATRISFAMSLVIMLPALVLAPQIVEVAFGPEYRPAAGALRVLAVASAVLVPFMSLSAVLHGLGRRREMAVLGLCAMLLNFALNLALIPPLGGVGAGYASLCAYLLLGTGGTLIACRTLPSSPRGLLVLRKDDVSVLASQVCAVGRIIVPRGVRR